MQSFGRGETSSDKSLAWFFETFFYGLVHPELSTSTQSQRTIANIGWKWKARSKDARKRCGQRIVSKLFIVCHNANQNRKRIKIECPT